MITIGTFNLNNLFSRFNFKGVADDSSAGPDAESSITYTFDSDSIYKLRTYKGKLVKGKDPEKTQTVASRIKSMNVDVLALQEVEDIDTLKQFNKDFLNDLYPFQVLVEGNDDRLIDVALLSKLPVGPVTSWRHAIHPVDTSRPVFSRDLLEVEIWNQSRTKKLLTVFNNPLKSQLVDFRTDPNEGKKENDKKRTRQAEIIAEIVNNRMCDGIPYAILGDMNDTVDSPCLDPIANNVSLGLVNALANPKETHPPKKDNPPPNTKSWTHRFKESGKPARYELYDQIWISPRLQSKLKGAWIDRRTNLTGDGSDHDPAWIVLDI
jgi:endonuclease/exonuclease/phosphatase family metal-dependent hydrolase